MLHLNSELNHTFQFSLRGINFNKEELILMSCFYLFLAEKINLISDISTSYKISNEGLHVFGFVFKDKKNLDDKMIANICFMLISDLRGSLVSNARLVDTLRLSKKLPKNYELDVVELQNIIDKNFVTFFDDSFRTECAWIINNDTLEKTKTFEKGNLNVEYLIELALILDTDKYEADLNKKSLLEIIENFENSVYADS